MEIRDAIHGRQSITEPVLQELINSRLVQRLKHVNQAGALKYTTPHATVTRYEHSIGVLLLLKRLGASLKEQIAGLLHDTPQTAFSHVIDYALEVNGHDYHEQHYKRILQASQVPRILEKHGYDYQEFLNLEQYTLLERPAPDLCADRIDYALRDTQIIRRVDMKHYLEYFTTHNGRVVMTDANKASAFAQEYLNSDKHIWANPREAAAYELLATALRQALKKNLITQQDFWLTDDELYAILDRSQDDIIQQALAQLNRNLRVRTSEKPADFSNKPKLRYINPHVQANDTVTRASEHDQELLNAIREHRHWHNQEQHIRILRHETPILETN